MKRFLIVIFALLYIGLSSGITLTIHHCMGKLVEVGIWQDETCNTCGAKHAHKSCCSTETQFIKISDDQNVDQLQVIKYVPMAIALLFDLRDLYNLPETEQEANIPVLPTPHLNGVGQTAHSSLYFPYLADSRSFQALFPFIVL